MYNLYYDFKCILLVSQTCSAKTICVGKRMILNQRSQYQLCSYSSRYGRRRKRHYVVLLSLMPSWSTSANEERACGGTRVVLSTAIAPQQHMILCRIRSDGQITLLMVLISFQHRSIHACLSVSYLGCPPALTNHQKCCKVRKKVSDARRTTWNHEKR